MITKQRLNEFAQRSLAVARERSHESLVIMKKELRSYFVTPIAYIVMTVFLAFTGFFFFKDYFFLGQAEMRSFFQLLPLVLSFVVPAVTMRLFAEEIHSGSIELLMTLPVSPLDAVMGKFLAGTVFVAIMVAPTLLYLVTIVITGSPDPGPIIGGYLGTLLLGGAYSAVGVLASSLSRNQIVAFIAGLSSCFALWLVDKIMYFVPARLAFIEYLGTDYHFRNISRGVIDSRDLVYFISLMAVCILLAVRNLERRR